MSADELTVELVIVARAVPTRVGGRRPSVRLSIDTEPKEVTLDSTVELARLIGQYLYKGVEVEASIERDEEGRIVLGTLDAFEPVLDIDPTQAWQSFYRQSASGWDTVEDIEKELDRG
jgi:hypothetical protein